MKAKHTLGPLTVRIDDAWPFRIRTFDTGGNCVFARDLPAYSTKQNTAAQAMHGAGLPRKDAELARTINERALADETLRAAAPELLALAQRVAALNRDAGEIGAGMLAQLVDSARAIVAKATGETP